MNSTSAVALSSQAVWAALATTVSAAAGNGTSHDPQAPEAALTRRELEILRLLADGLDTAAVGERLHVSRATVRNHVQNVFAKLGVHNRLAAVAYATKHRLL